MTRYSNAAFAVIAALLLTAVSFYEVVTIPAVSAPAVVEIA